MNSVIDSTQKTGKVNLRKVLLSLFLFSWIFLVLVLSTFLILSGGVRESFQTLTQVLGGRAGEQTLGWQSWEVVGGFAFLTLWGSIILGIGVGRILGVYPKPFFKRWLPFLKTHPVRLAYTVLALTAAEEIVFRWFPLVMLVPREDSGIRLWAIILFSSASFGLLHLGNQDAKGRKIAFVLPQMFAGIIFSGVFLTFGFAGSLVVHLVMNCALLTPIKTLLVLTPEAFEKYARSD